MSQDELRKIYNERLVREKQRYIAGQIGVDPSLLSRFKCGKIDLYPRLFEKLQGYLTAN